MKRDIYKTDQRSKTNWEIQEIPTFKRGLVHRSNFTCMVSF